MLIFLSQFLGLRQRKVGVEPSLGTRLRNAAGVLAALVLAHTVAITVLEPELLDYGAWSAFWLTITTVLTVGYGDISPETLPGQIATTLLLYTAAVFIVAQVATLAVDVRTERRARKRAGTWRWNMRDHLVVVGSPAAGAQRFFIRLLTELRAEPAFAEVPVLILTERFGDAGLPDAVRDMGVAYYRGSPHDSDALIAAGVQTAAYIVLLADDENHPRSDSLNFDVLLELHELYTPAKIVSEVVDEGNRERFRRFGSHRLIRPSRAYPEFIVRTLTCPGSEVIIEDLLHVGGDGGGAGNTTRRYHVRLRDVQWRDVAGAILGAGYGTALGYVNENRRVVTNPPPDAVVNGRGLLVLTDVAVNPTRAEVHDTVTSLTPVA